MHFFSAEEVGCVFIGADNFALNIAVESVAVVEAMLVSGLSWQKAS